MYLKSYNDWKSEKTLIPQQNSHKRLRTIQLTSQVLDDSENDRCSLFSELIGFPHKANCKWIVGTEWNEEAIGDVTRGQERLL